MSTMLGPPGTTHNPNDFETPDMAVKRAELELQRQDGDVLHFPSPLPPIALFPGTTFEAVSCNGVPCEWLRTPMCESSPVVYLHMHGGGYYRGNTRIEAGGTSFLCGLSQVRCLTVDYRCSPPTTDGYRTGPFPAAINDCFTAYRWLVNPDGGGVSPEHVVVGGCSAGGGLAVALLLGIRDRGLQQPAAALSLSPWVDLTQSGQSYHTNHGKCFITKGYLDWASKQYLQGSDPRAPLASPIFADLSGLAPILVQVGGNETLLDDATTLCAKVGRAGGEIACEVYQGQTHGFMLGDGDGGTLELDGGPHNPARLATLSLARYILQVTGQDPQSIVDPWVAKNDAKL